MVLIFFVVGILGAVLGLPNVRIAGGQETDIAKYPFALQVYYMDRLECGGALVSTSFALTAGHCVFDKTMEYIYVRLGTSSLTDGGETFTVPEIIYHPNFVMLTQNYDAALLRLSGIVTTPNAQPVQLAIDDSAITEGATVYIAGWGWMERNDNDEFATTIRETDLQILGDKACKKTYNMPLVTEVMFCANYTGSVIKDFCYGDYGGPAVIDGVLQGIITFGDGCADGTNGKVFTRVSKLRKWILSIIESV